jgi:hypothetical protein
LTALKANLDPVRLLAEIRAAQQRLVALADNPMTGDAAAPTLEVFLAGLRTAKEGEVRPTAQSAVKAVRWWRSLAIDAADLPIRRGERMAECGGGSVIAHPASAFSDRDKLT